ncbi:MAG: AAA family ATPase [bacterium]
MHADDHRQSYLDYWGFERAPFALTPDPEMLYLSKQHRECMLRLQYAIVSNKGGALLVSENPGDGKTSVLKRLQLDLINSVDERYRVVYIDHPTLTPNQVLWEILRQLGFGETKGEKVQNLQYLREALEEMHERGERVVFILDEGQLLADKPELLQEFRVLLNFTVGETFLLTFIFSGQRELEATMKRLPELYQRLPVRYFLHSMDQQDTGRMLAHRVKVAGYRNGELFTPEAVKEIYRYSTGIPRVACTVADLALVVGQSRNVRRVADREVMMAIRDLDRTTGDGYHYFHFLRSAGASTPDEEKEIAEAEARMDEEQAEEAMRRLEAREEKGTPTREPEPEEVPAEPARTDSPPEEPAVTGSPDVDRVPDPVRVSSWPDDVGEDTEERWTDEGGDVRGEDALEIGPYEELREKQPSVLSPSRGEQRWEWEGGQVMREPVTGPMGDDAERVEPEGSAPEGEGVPAEDLPEEADEPTGTLVHCPVCGTRQLESRSTCKQCGAPLHWICPSCEHKNSAHRARCDECGQSLSRAVTHAENELKEAVTGSVAGPEWGFKSTPGFSLKLGEGEKVLAVVENKSFFGRGVKVRARVEAWGSREKKADVVVTNHRLHVVSRELQSRIPFHEIQGLRAGKGKLHLFHGTGSLRMEYPTGKEQVHELVHALIDFLEFQAGRFRV